MDPVTLSLMLALEALKTFELLYQDMPPGDRRAAWKEWFQFWRDLSGALGGRK